MGHHILMGRKTYESIGKPLAGRVMVVISRQQDFHPEGCQVARSLEEGLDIARRQAETEAFIIGGGEIFSQAMAIVERIYLTRVHTVVGCDVFFPKIADEFWRLIDPSFHEADGKNDYPCTFKTLIKSSPHTG
jgi:dihydrofolate reductase